MTSYLYDQTTPQRTVCGELIGQADGAVTLGVAGTAVTVTDASKLVEVDACPPVNAP
jgi:hypothetical protein